MNRKQAENLIFKIRSAINGVMVPCGSYRRQKTNIRDLDLVVIDIPISTCVQTCQKIFKKCEIIREGEKLTTLILDGYQVEFYKTTINEQGAALLHSTGSGIFNQSLRLLAKKQGFKLNQYGLWKDDQCIESTSEVGILLKLGIGWIAPEERNNPIGVKDVKNSPQKRLNIMVAEVLKKIAKKYKKEKDAWRAKTFDAASAIIKNYHIPVNKIKDLTSIEFIGSSIATEIQDIIKTGTSKRLQ